MAKYFRIGGYYGNGTCVPPSVISELSLKTETVEKCRELLFLEYYIEKQIPTSAHRLYGAMSYLARYDNRAIEACAEYFRFDGLVY